MGVFTTACEQFDNPAFASFSRPKESKFLLKPPQGSFSNVENHAEGDRFTSGNEDYQVIFALIAKPTTQDRI